MKKVLSILFVLAVIACVMSGCDGDTTTTTTAAPTTTTTTAATTTTTSATTTVAAKTYEDVLAELGIVHMETFIGLETASYVYDLGGIIDCQDYGYENDIVKQIVQTSYVSVDGYSDADKKTLEDSMKAAFAMCDTIDCATVTYDMGTKYFKVRVACVDLDNPDNVSALVSAGLLSGSTGTISMSQSDAAFLQLGYVKK